MAFGPVRLARSVGLRGLVLVGVVVLLGNATVTLPTSSHNLPSPAARMTPSGGTNSPLAREGLASPGRTARSAGMTQPGEGPTLSVGSVIRTVFPGFNTSLLGSFTSSVSAWQVGSPAYVPTTDSLWFPQRSTPVPGVPPPSVSPAAVFNLSTGQFDDLVTNVSNASAFVYDPGNGLLYATDPTTDSVAVVNPRTGEVVVPSIPVGSAPDAITFDPPSNNIFVANSGSANVTVIDALNNKVSIGNVPVGSDPVALVDDPQDGFVFVANAGNSYVSVITAMNPSSAHPSIPLFDGPAFGLAYSPRTDRLLVTIPSSIYGTLIAASSGSVLSALLQVGKGMVPAVSSANGTEFVLGNASGGDLVVLNSTVGTTIDSGIAVDHNATQLAVDPQTGLVYCWTSNARVLESVNLSSNTITSTAPTTLPQLNALGYATDESRMYASSGNGSLVYGIDPLHLVSESPSISSPSPVLSVVADSMDERLYVGSASNLEVYNATSGEFIANVSGLNGKNSQLVLDQPDNLLWLMNSLVGVAAVNLTTDTVAFSTGISTYSGSMQGIAIDPESSSAFVLVSAGTVAVRDSRNGTLEATSVGVGTNVTSVLFDPADNQIYAAGDKVSLLNGTTYVLDAATTLVGSPHKVLGAVYEPSRQDVYIAESGLLPGEEGALDVLEGSSVAASGNPQAVIPVGEDPTSFGIVTTLNNAVPGSAMIWVANQLSGTVSVVSSPPEITSFSANPSTIDLGSTVTFSVGYDGGAGPSTVSYQGLPSGCVSVDKFLWSCEPMVSGTFTVVANVTDSFGFSDDAPTTLSVLHSLSVRIGSSLSTFPDLDVGVPLRVSAAVSGGLPPYTYSWSFGDGFTATTSNASHSYQTPGAYPVSVEVRDSTGAVNSSSAAIVVVPRPTVAVWVTPENATDVNIPLSLGAIIIGGTGALEENWSFGDGDSTTGANVSHAWTRAGNYSVTFAYEDELGVTVSESVEIVVHPSLTASFASVNGTSTNPAYPSTPVLFSSAVSGGTPPYSVVWSFGDGSYGAGLSASHRYASAGIYTVGATLTDAVGATVHANLTVTVTASSSGGTLPSLTGGFASGVFLGLLVGGVLAAVVLFAVGSRAKTTRPPSGPVSPYVPP